MRTVYHKLLPTYNINYFLLVYFNPAMLYVGHSDAVRDFHAITQNPRSVMLEWRPPLKPGVSRYKVE